MSVVAENFFSRLSHNDGLNLEKYLQTGFAAKGTVIISLDDDTDKMHFILTGSCKIYERIHVGDEEMCLNTANLKAPLFVGESSILDIENRTAAVVASSDVTFMTLSKRAFDRLKKESPDLAFMLMQHIAQDLHQRFHGFEENVREACNVNAADNNMVLRRINQYIGKVKPCHTDLARKLFYFNNNKKED